MSAGILGLQSDVLAQLMIVRALDNVTRPDVLLIAEATALSVAEVSALVDQETARRRPAPSPAVVTRLREAPPTPQAVSELFEYGLKHPDPTVRAAAKRAKRSMDRARRERLALMQALEDSWRLKHRKAAR